jgi:hypothetical protein
MGGSWGHAMTSRKPANQLLLMCPFLACIAVGIVTGAILTPDYCICEMSPELLADAKEAHADYKANRIVRRVRVEVYNGCDLDVHIVRWVRGGAYGFARARNSLRHFWVNGQGFDVFRFDENDLFVCINDSYLQQLDNGIPRDSP